MIVLHVSDNLVLLRNDFHIRAASIAVNHQIGHVLLRISDTERRSTFRRGDLRNDIVFCQIYLIIIWCSDLRLM